MSITLDDINQPVATREECADGRALDTLDFTLPPELEASEPAEARGLPRDGVRLMVSHCGGSAIAHARFSDIGEFLRAGDLLVINTSGTLNAALDATREDGTPLELHLSTHLPGDLWTVELRSPGEHGTRPFRVASAGEALQLPSGGEVLLLARYATDRAAPSGISTRLWLATLHLPEPLETYLAQHGFPIRYSYVPRRWPSEAYQTVYATELGSAELPSAGRAFTPKLMTRLMAQGVRFAPLLLHTGVASMEDHEPPYEEYYRVPLATARAVNEAKDTWQRVIAVGTTVVRALETVTDESGVAHPGEGWTSLVVTPERGVRAVDGLLTGLHEPRASHLAMLEAICGREHLRLAYAEALRERYLWHEFGDLHLLLQ
ncbi:MAG TPA: S-adenosylmethionine:tRNA ribosyltransferase-isomerase [Ktedonobacterales bacterium]|jgi:S-adenosylmethionine:tRNA ribosyltransferase-isomerase|nr:S-adenosylmethionine:tRNA ribosyltransferase-isomerase [Ktedonobacterales bacterium]